MSPSSSNSTVRHNHQQIWRPKDPQDIPGYVPQDVIWRHNPRLLLKPLNPSTTTGARSRLELPREADIGWCHPNVVQPLFSRTGHIAANMADSPYGILPESSSGGWRGQSISYHYHYYAREASHVSGQALAQGPSHWPGLSHLPGLQSLTPPFPFFIPTASPDTPPIASTSQTASPNSPKRKTPGKRARLSDATERTDTKRARLTEVEEKARKRLARTSKPRTHVCDICGLSVIYLCDLRTHYKNVHPEDVYPFRELRYPCGFEDCKNTFIFPGKAQEHARKYHPGFTWVKLEPVLD